MIAQTSDRLGSSLTRTSLSDVKHEKEELSWELRRLRSDPIHLGNNARTNGLADGRTDTKKMKETYTTDETLN